MKKRILAILLCTVMVLSTFAACGEKPAEAVEEPVEEAEQVAEDVEQAVEDVEESIGDEEETQGDEEAPAAAGVDGLKIGISIYKYDDNFMTLYRTELERYLTAGGAEVQVMDGKNDQAEQTNQIQNFITQGYDVLIVNLVQASAASQITDMAHEAGIPIVYINREPDPEEEQRWIDEGIKATYVGADARQSGTYQGEIIADLPNQGDANGDGKLSYVMIQGDPENVDAQFRTEFSIKALEDAGIEVELLVSERGDWDQAKGQEIAANALVAHGEAIDVIFCNNDAMAMGALQAIEAAGRTINEDIYLVGVDALAEALEAIDQGRMTGTVFNDHISQARTAGEAASDFAGEKDVDNVIMVDYIKVTPDNAAEITDIIS